MTLKLASSSPGAQSHTRAQSWGDGPSGSIQSMGRQQLLRWLLMTVRRETHVRVIWASCFPPVSGNSPGAAWWGSLALYPQTLRCVSLTFRGSKWTLLLVGPLKSQVPCHRGTSPFSSHQLCGAVVCALGPPLQPQPRLQTRHTPSPRATEWPTGRAGRRGFWWVHVPCQKPQWSGCSRFSPCCHRESGCPAFQVF